MPHPQGRVTASGSPRVPETNGDTYVETAT